MAIEVKIGCPLLDETVFKEDKECCGTRWGRLDTHVCSTYMFPVGISKCDDIIFEDNVNCFNQGIYIIVVENVSNLGLELVQNVFNGGPCSDVGVHRYGVACKEFCSREYGNLLKKVL